MNDNQSNGEEMTWKSLNDMITPTYSPSPSPTSTPLGVKRSRISRACDICRRKKTKCDATETRKCKTCIQYGWECTFNDTTKKRGPPKGYIESLENRLKKMENLLEQMQHQDKPESIADEPEEPPRKRREPSIVELPASIEHSKTASYLGSSSGYYLVRDILSTDKEVIEKVDQYPRISSVTGVENKGPVAFRKINTTDDDVMIVCDKTLAEHIGQVEADKSRINSDIAPKELLDELVLKFFELNHAVLPVVDKQPFLDAYYGRIQPPPATVLMYAIWAHTCSLLSKEDPLFVKYNVDREQLYDILWEHTSSILRFEYLTPRYATIQALVLICTYPTTYKTFHRNWIRAGMAVRMAQELGLHRTMEKLPLTKEMTEARKRLWYCVYITDRWCCAVLGRPLAISDADCDIELPDITHNGNDYTVFVNFVKLSGILGEVLSRIYSPKAKSHGSKSMQTYHTVQSIHFMLNDWLQQLPNHLRIESQDVNTALNYGNIKFEEAGPLMICYHFVHILLYRIFLVANKNEVLPELFDRANECCTTAAKSIVDIARGLSASAIVCFGVNFAGYAIFQASLIHVYNSTSSNPDVARAAKAYVNISIEECIKPLAKTVHCIPKTSLGLIQALMELTGANKDGPKSTNDVSNDITNNATTTPSSLRPSPPKPQPSPMSMHAIVSDWESNTGSNSTYNNGGLPAMQAPEPFNNNNSTAAWQSLFASAGAPFFENESDWQVMLSSLFDENQMKAINNSFI